MRPLGQEVVQGVEIGIEEVMGADEDGLAAAGAEGGIAAAADEDVAAVAALEEVVVAVADDDIVALAADDVLDVEDVGGNARRNRHMGLEVDNHGRVYAE
jgi:hypothetical protein